MTNAEVIQQVISQTWAVSLNLDSLTEEEAKAELTKIGAQALVRINNGQN